MPERSIVTVCTIQCSGEPRLPFVLVAKPKQSKIYCAVLFVSCVNTIRLANTVRRYNRATNLSYKPTIFPTTTARQGNFTVRKDDFT